MLTLLKTLSDPNTLKALIIPFRPALSRVLLIVIGMFLGVLLVYLPAPGFGIKFHNAEPVHLNEGDKDQWVKNSAITYVDGAYSEEQIKRNLEDAGYGPAEVQALADANAEFPQINQALLAVKDLPSQDVANDQQAKVSTSIVGNVIPLFCLVGLFLFGCVLGIGLSFRPIAIGPWRKGAVARSAATAGLGEAEQQRRKALQSAKDNAGEFEADLGEPLVKFMSAYVLGDDLYDDSFAIEPDGGFAGECGIEVSETIGVGDPKKVTAFEVWMFDQAEIQTLTYVVMSEHAYNDQALRAKLAPRGEAVLAVQGKPITLETKTLRMQIRIIDLEYGEGSLPPNSFFGKMTFALAVWLKEGTEGVGGLPTMPPMSGSDFAPPPQVAPQTPPPPPLQAPPPQQIPPQQPSSGGMQPLTSNPMPGQVPPQQPPPQQPRPLTSNPMSGQVPPQQPPPQQPRPLTSNPMPGQMPPQQPPPQQPPAGGMRPLTSNPPPSPTGRRPDDDEDDGDVPPLPRRQFPPSDDPFGDTGQM